MFIQSHIHKTLQNGLSIYTDLTSKLFIKITTLLNVIRVNMLISWLNDCVF